MGHPKGGQERHDPAQGEGNPHPRKAKNGAGDAAFRRGERDI